MRVENPFILITKTEVDEMRRNLIDDVSRNVVKMPEEELRQVYEDGKARLPIILFPNVAIKPFWRGQVELKPLRNVSNNDGWSGCTY